MEKCTNVNMKNEVFSNLDTLGIGLKYLINGAIGAVIWAIYRKARIVEAIRQVIIGGVVAGYFTPVVIAKTNMQMEFVGFTSFVVGMLGMVIIDSIYKTVAEKLRKLKDAWSIVNKND